MSDAGSTGARALESLVFPGRAYSPEQGDFLMGDLLAQNTAVEFFAFTGACVLRA